MIKWLVTQFQEQRYQSCLNKVDSLSLNTEDFKGSQVEKGMGGVDIEKSEIPERYKNMGFTKVGQKKKSTSEGKKWMVLAKKGDEYKVVHGGDSSMKDFSQHKDEDRQEAFWDRMGGKNGSKAKDPFSPLYWHKKFGTW